MKLKEGILLHHDRDDEYIGITMGDLAETFNGMIRYNATTHFILEKLQSDISKEELVGILCKEYTVSPQEAAEDLEKLLQELDEIGLLENYSN
ncbi:PqqD family protein [Streptococcus ruminantium]|uniref:PqqD family protein n=1 Tax=Streptococcus ruminantium TaxID=1917441 RepID=UPI0012DC0BD4|nr:PqqD family protein [Streptococcus ruminantium]